jgi:hypothetical protein
MAKWKKILDLGVREETPKEIKGKLESLTGDERLDASAIKNLPESTVRGVGSFGIREAPKDGKTYGRKDRDWTEVVISETDPLSLHLNQTSPQTFTGGTVTGTGLLQVVGGVLGKNVMLTVSDTAPANPNVGDLWVDIS